MELWSSVRTGSEAILYYGSRFSATFFVAKLKIALPKFTRGTRRSDKLREKFRHRCFHQRYFHYDAIREVTWGDHALRPSILSSISLSISIR